VEAAITRRAGEALDALDGLAITSDARDALAELARFVAWRDH
jgi:hypothetical protein